MKFFIVLYLLTSLSLGKDTVEWRSLTNGHNGVHYHGLSKKEGRRYLNAISQSMKELSIATGLDAISGVELFIADSPRGWDELSGFKLPEWSAGSAFKKNRTIFIRTNPQYPGQTYITLKHELFHILLGAGFPKTPIPLWFEEGCALYYSNDLFFDLQKVLSEAVASDNLVPLEEIESLASFRRERAIIAYGQSFEAIQTLLRHYGPEPIKRLLKNLKKEKNWNKAFYRAYKIDTYLFEKRLFSYLKKKYKNHFFINFKSFIWTLIPLLALAAIAANRLRRREAFKKWEEEEKEISPY